MPRLPAPLARMIETRGRPCAVIDIEDLSPSFRRVHLIGEDLQGHEWAPCQVTTFLVSPTEFRRYTPDAFDAMAGRMSILFYRHSVAVAGPLRRAMRGWTISGSATWSAPWGWRRLGASGHVPSQELCSCAATAPRWDCGTR